MRLHHLSDELVAKTTEDLLELVNLRKLLNQYFSKVEISKVLKSEPGNLSISYSLIPTMNTSSEVLVDKVISHLSNTNDDRMMLDQPYTVTYEKIDDHHFLIKLHNSSISEMHKQDPHTHKDETKEELLLPKDDVLVDIHDLNINGDSSDDDYVLNKSVLNDSTENAETQLVSEYSYARTLRDLYNNYKMIAPDSADEYMNYTSGEQSTVAPERFVIYKNKAGIAIMIKDLETDKFWELDR